MRGRMWSTWNALSTNGKRLDCTFFFFQAEDGIRYVAVTGVQTCALPISPALTAMAGIPAPTGSGESAEDAFETSLPDYAARNRAHWNAASARYQAEQGRQLRDSGGLAWGVWQIPEAELRILGDVAGRTTLELGCGAAQWSIGLERVGAVAIGVDLSEEQLKAAWVASREAGVTVRLVHASGEAVPLPDACVDIVFSDWGAFRFADPDLVVPEAARLLRPGGLLAFSTP